MRGICGLYFDQDKIFASLAGRTKKDLVFLEELEIERIPASESISDMVKEAAQLLQQKITEAQRRHSFRLERVFLELPRNFGSRKIVEETVPLRKRKKVTTGDIFYIKKYLEDKFLDWDDFCVHNIPLSYGIEDTSYLKPPLGLWARKIKLRSILTWVKDRLYREIEDTFDNVNMSFGGFVLPELSMLAVLPEGFGLVGRSRMPAKIQAVISLDYTGSFFVLRNNQGHIFSGQFDFGLKKILDELAGRFSLSLDLAREVFSRYIYFKEVPYFKEVTIKKEGGYLKLSSQTLNFFIKNYIKNQIINVIRQIEAKTNESDFSVSFIGRLNKKEGFGGFLKECISQEVVLSRQTKVFSSSFGCLRYGLQPFLEKTQSQKNHFLQSFLDTYRDYF